MMMKRFITFTLSVILAIALASCAGAGPKSLGKKPLCVGDDCSKVYPWLTNAKVREYEVLEKALVGGGTEAIILDASKSGCFDRIKIVGGKEVKQCWGAVSPANPRGGPRTWGCEELSRGVAPQCYEVQK